MKIFNVYNIVKKNNVISQSDGIKFFNFITDNYTGEAFVISFEAIERVSSAFLNASIGRFMMNNSDAAGKLNIIHSSKLISDKIEAVLSNQAISKRYDQIVDTAISA